MHVEHSAPAEPGSADLYVNLCKAGPPHAQHIVVHSQGQVNDTVQGVKKAALPLS